ncbi:hypothetical protein EJV47_03815 [Hymenobacter gummosus]|uniref:OmpA-like domain-containing protein n=1 Tax=Hymenobacter gummosus TaxID=1776032 RepID=A0A3S0IQM8_9BACT|nr:OmpA family protein [Hymenobacter gummosus]RTQ52162.1 hypothetical protein EJV47_03815 [Hymenobacter gummosus]
MKRLYLLFLAVLCWLRPISTPAQTANVSMSGTVQATDNQGANKATVTVVHIPSGIRRAVATDAAGKFTVPNLFTGGPYMVQVSQAGYRAQVANDIFLLADKPSNLSFTLSRIPAEAAAVPAAAAKKKDARRTPAAAASTPPPAPTPAPVASTAAAASAPLPTPAPGAATAAPASAAPATATASSAASPRRAAADEPPIVDNRRFTPRRPYTPAAATKGAAPVVPGHYDAKTGNYVYETGAPTTLKLPDGRQIQGVGINSTESLLHRFITDAQQHVDTVDLTKGWLNFDRVFFEPGKATLTQESKNQLRNVATMLQAFPKVRVKIGGYTDSTGTYKVNKQLSEARARTAWATLVELGVPASRMDARGYGPRYGIAPNLTQEGRAQNRRLSIKVLQK